MSAFFLILFRNQHWAPDMQLLLGGVMVTGSKNPSNLGKWFPFYQHLFFPPSSLCCPGRAQFLCYSSHMHKKSLDGGGRNPCSGKKRALGCNLQWMYGWREKLWCFSWEPQGAPCPPCLGATTGVDFSVQLP